MARPVKKGLDYFSLDCIVEDNLAFIEAKHGLPGFAIYIKLLQKIYQQEGYFCIWKEENLYLFAKDCMLPVQSINQIIDDCLKQDLFDRSMFLQYQILTSAGIQKRYRRIVREAKRHGCEIDLKYFIPEKDEIKFPEQKSGVSSGKKAVNPELTPVFPELTTQSKVKYSKVKESKVHSDGSASSLNGKEGAENLKFADQIVLPENITSKLDKPVLKPHNTGKGKEKKSVKQKEPELYWQELIDTYYEFFKAMFHVEPSFPKRDFSYFKNLIGLLKKRAEQKKVEWTEEAAVTRLKSFLTAAFADKWLGQHFTLANLEKQFNSIITAQNGFKVIPAKLSGNLSSLLERAGKNELKLADITHDHFNRLADRNLISISPEIIQYRRKQLTGTNQASELRLLSLFESGSEEKIKAAVITDKPALERLAVFYFMKQEAKEPKTNLREIE